jgi:hypothetical protein
MEPCEVCGATIGVQAFGIDSTPLCPRHYAEAENRVKTAEDEAWYRELLNQCYADY